MFSKILNVNDRKKLAEDLFSAEELDRYKKDVNLPLLLFSQIESKTVGKDQICAPK